ncbi:molecular chaperone DnaK, partial [Leptospira sp. mixed culture ATI2-C-A1]
GEREMASANRTLGRFDLVGIPSAPRGVPQIEVTFDIDANGIVHVSAKDLGTGKEQKIRIESSSGLSEEEIKKMVKDAEAHAEEDKKLREAADTKNELEAIVYQLEKTIGESADKLDESEKQRAQDEIKRGREAMESGDVERMKASRDSIQQVAMQIGQKIYSQAGPEAGAPGADPGANAGQGASESSAGGEKVVDADYTVVDEDKK